MLPHCCHSCCKFVPASPGNKKLHIWGGAQRRGELRRFQLKPAHLCVLQPSLRWRCVGPLLSRMTTDPAHLQRATESGRFPLFGSLCRSSARVGMSRGAGIIPLLPFVPPLLRRVEKSPELQARCRFELPREVGRNSSDLVVVGRLGRNSSHPCCGWVLGRNSSDLVVLGCGAGIVPISLWLGALAQKVPISLCLGAGQKEFRSRCGWAPWPE